MKKLHTFILGMLLMTGCSEEVKVEDGSVRYISFNVTDNVNLPGPEVITRSAVFSTPVESDLGDDIVLITTVEKGISRPHPQKRATRGAQVTGSSSFTFSVSEYDNAGSAIKFNNITPTYSSTSGTTYSYQSGQPWESNAVSSAYRFYAYSPCLDATAGNASPMTNGLTLSANRKSITYDCSDVIVSGQQDLMTAYASSTYSTSGVALAFGHRCCAVRIQLGSSWNTGYTIRSISFSNVVKSGTLSIETGTWSNLGTAGAYTPSGITNASTANGGVAVYLMMVPQTLSGCTMTVCLRRSGDSFDSVLKTTLSTVWNAGETVTYTISPSTISSVTVNYPSGNNRWYTGADYVDGPVSSYTTNDHFGLFAVDKDGKIVISNQDLSASNGASPSITLPSGNLYSSQYTYYLYHPYKSDLTSTYSSLAKGQTYSGTATADAFFSSVISGWAVASNQSGGIRSSDLQVAELSGSTFTMVHKMGLARLQLNAPSNIPYNKVYKNNSYDATQSNALNSGKGTASRSAVASFDTNVPFLSNGVYYYVLKGSVTINSVQDNVNKWTEGHTFAQGAGTASAVWTAYSVRNDWDAVNLYYEYTGGSSYTFTIPTAGNYLVQCWGASGGTGALSGYSEAERNSGNYYGRGAYTEGYINLTTSTNSGRLYVYVGGKGPNGIVGSLVGAGYNGGGSGGADVGSNDGAGGGGGATDIRLTNNATAWSSRIMVAGGGGGGSCCYVSNGVTNYVDGMHAGNPNVSGKCSVWGTASGWTPTVNQTTGNALGQGANGIKEGHGRGGGGGGYYGGTSYSAGKGAGGSSYISGNASCTTSNGMTFSSSLFKKGTDSTVPSTTIGGSATALGYVDGYARFSLIRE